MLFLWGGGGSRCPFATRLRVLQLAKQHFSGHRSTFHAERLGSVVPKCRWVTYADRDEPLSLPSVSADRDEPLSLREGDGMFSF